MNWAKFNVEKSINQPLLPHAIVVLNAVDMGSGGERWTVDDVTSSFFRDVAGAVAIDPGLRGLAQLRNINPEDSLSSRELLKCFYSEVRVIRVPAKRPERYSLIDEQIRQLRNLIIDAGEKAHHAKTLSRRLNDVDALQEYLQASFDHFATNIEQPFDFKSVSLRTRAIAQDFGDHIINLASTVQENTTAKGKTLFKGLVSLVASCILLDYVRNNLPGRPLAVAIKQLKLTIKDRSWITFLRITLLCAKPLCIDSATSTSPVNLPARSVYSAKMSSLHI